MDEVSLMKTEEPPVNNKGIPIACKCGASVVLATSIEALTRGQRYFTCGYDLSDGRGHGCGYKKWLESSILEEFKELKEERIEIEEFVEELNVKIDDLQVKFQEVAEQKQKSEMMEFLSTEQKQDSGMLDILSDATLKIQDLELQYEALEAKYGQMSAKYELLQYELNKLKRKQG